jgi:hypothetical protein
MFAKNPSLGEGNGPRPGTKECRYVYVYVFSLDPDLIRVLALGKLISDTFISRSSLLYPALPLLSDRQNYPSGLKRD